MMRTIGPPVVTDEMRLIVQTTELVAKSRKLLRDTEGMIGPHAISGSLKVKPVVEGGNAAR